EMTIVGVIKDFHSSSLKYGIGPLCISKIHSRSLGHNLYLRLLPGDISEDLTAIAAVFRKHFPYYPFNAQFQEDINEREYSAELRWQKIVNYTCGMAIFVACCGLLGLSLLAAQSRTKEIGIRKVLGASVRCIVALLSGNFIKPVLTGILIALLPAGYIMNKWLENFTYRIELQWWIFALAGLPAIIVALLTVSFQSLKAALANPAESLRLE
ncbi:MAG TPA: FtsX-like permease family protein, partial [Anseongella sp.]|nr:FtsX-like permease family protein [Anseongella sp.]